MPGTRRERNRQRRLRRANRNRPSDAGGSGAERSGSGRSRTQPDRTVPAKGFRRPEPIIGLDIEPTVAYCIRQAPFIHRQKHLGVDVVGHGRTYRLTVLGAR